MSYRVTKSLWILYNSLSAATLVLIDVAPSVQFRCAVTLSAVTGHTDCAGTVTVGSEVLTFTAAGKKTTTTYLSSLPTITTSGIDCNIKVVCVDASGQELYKESLTSMLCRWIASSKLIETSGNQWTQSSAQVLSTDTNCLVGGILRYLSEDYTIIRVDAYSKLSGREFLRRLYVTGP